MTGEMKCRKGHVQVYMGTDAKGESRHADKRQRDQWNLVQFSSIFVLMAAINLELRSVHTP